MASLKSQLKLEIETGTSRNLVLNPTGSLGVTGWTNPGVSPDSIEQDTSSTPIAVDTFSLKFVPGPFTGGFIIRARDIAMIPGEYVGVEAAFYRPTAAGSLTVAIELQFLDSSKSQIGSTSVASQPLTSGSVTVTRSPVVAPADTAFVRIKLKYSGSTGGVPLWFGKVFAKTAATSGAAAAAWALPTFTDVLGDSFSVNVEQGNELDGVSDTVQPGILTAVVSGSTIDPAVNSQIYRGGLIRLSALVSGVWVPQFTGSIEAVLSTYEDLKTVVTVTATDAGAALTRTGLDYCGTESLENVLTVDVAEATNVATNDGAGNTVYTTNYMSYQQGSTCTDWLRRACNTFGGYAWVDKSNVVQARELASLSTTSVTMSDSSADVGATYYTGIDLSFSSNAIVNELTVTRINVDETKDNGSKTYGPYAASKSITKWGKVPADMEVLDGIPSDLADAVLPIFATPTIYPSSVTFNATEDITKATSLNLYQKVRVKRGAILDNSFRLIRISHSITAGSWVTTVFLRPLETSTAVVIAPPPAGDNTGPSDSRPGGFPRIASMYRGSNQTVSNSSNVNVLFDTVIDTSGITWDSSNRYFTVPKAGRYQVDSSILWSSNGTGVRRTAIQINGSERIRSQVAGSSAADHAVTCGGTLELAAGDTIGVTVIQSSGGNLAIVGARTTYVTVGYVGP